MTLLPLLICLSLVSASEPEEQNAPATFSRGALAKILENEKTVVEKTTDEYGRPLFVVKAGIGLPNLLNAHVEIWVHDNITVELGAGTGLLPTVYEGSIRWRPDATCWGCKGKNYFSIGFGVDPGFYWTNETYKSGAGVMVTATVDALYIHRFAKHFGLSAGSRLGLGAVTEFGGSRDWTRVEPALKINLLQLGLVF